MSLQNILQSTHLIVHPKTQQKLIKMEIFRGQNLIEFAEHFKTDEDCKKYLSEVKWSGGYTCRKCSHTKSQIRKDFSRTCNICSNTESSTADTLFHKVKFGLRKAFFIYFELTNTTKSFSSSQVAVRFGVREDTAKLFIHKVRESMKSSENQHANRIVPVDEFVVIRQEQSKPVKSNDSEKQKSVYFVELTEGGEVDRFYNMEIEDYLAKSLRKIFEKHISQEAEIPTDNWKGYNPNANDYKITHALSDN